MCSWKYQTCYATDGWPSVGNIGFSYSTLSPNCRRLFRSVNCRLRRNRRIKRYGALFTYLTTRAMYLDLTPSLSSDDFLLVFRRYLSFYGRPETMHSDNGKNSVGAEKELLPQIQELNRSEAVNAFAKQRGIKCFFQSSESRSYFSCRH